MLKANNTTKRYGDRLILDGVSFVVNRGECAGIVAPNGAGKTTLLDVIACVLPADGGAIETSPPAARIAYVRQGHVRDTERTVGAVFPAVFRVLDIDRRLESAGASLSACAGEADFARAQAEYDRALDDATSDDGAIGDAWRALALRMIAPGEQLGALSGGEQTKLSLIDAFTSQADILLLDEPTNNLDLPAASWLGEQLAAFEGPVVLVSHDRALLDEHVDVIFDLDPATAKLEAFAGNYSEYAAEKARRRDAQWDAYRRQQDRERKVEREIRAIKDTASKREHLSQNDFYRRKAKKVARRGVVLEKRLRREMAGDARVDKPTMRPYRLKPQIAHAARGGDRMLAADNLRLEAGGRVLLDCASLSIGWGERVVIIGPNGAGKTTLLRALTGEVTPSSGVVQSSPSTRVGYLPQEEILAANEESGSATPLTAVRAAAPLSETEARRFLHRFLFEGDAAHTPIAALSYGERRRLSLAMILLNGVNLLVLDEPTNHLDIPSREALEAALDAYEGAMLAVTHDRYFIERFAQRVLLLQDGRLREV